MTDSVGGSDNTEETMNEWCVWVAYYSDYSGIAFFETEIEALRFAVNKSMTVKKFVSGDEVR